MHSIYIYIYIHIMCIYIYIYITTITITMIMIMIIIAYTHINGHDDGVATESMTRRSDLQSQTCYLRPPLSNAAP